MDILFSRKFKKVFKIILVTTRLHRFPRESNNRDRGACDLIGGRGKKIFRGRRRVVKKSELVQACEKIYKDAEDAVKILAKEHAPVVYDEAEHNGRWLASLPREAVRMIEVTFSCKGKLFSFSIT